MNAVGVSHLVFSCVAIVAGAGVCLLPKGTRWHRTLGHVYATSMLGLIVTAFSIYDLFGGFGPFHFAGVVAAVSLAMGLGTALLRRPRQTWLEHHATWMSWSYVGLLAAFAAETLTRLVLPVLAPRMPEAFWPLFWALVGVGGLAASYIGHRLIKTRLPTAIARTPQALREERRRLAETN